MEDAAICGRGRTGEEEVIASSCACGVQISSLDSRALQGFIIRKPRVPRMHLLYEQRDARGVAE